MKCLVAGGYGFIGRGVVRALIEAGHEVTCAGRDVELGRRLIPDINWIYCDFNHDLNPDLWAERLEGFDAVVNAVGILQSDLKDEAEMVHGEGARALFLGADFAGVKRLVHISATTVGKAEASGNSEQESVIIEQPSNHLTEYEASKLTGEVYLAETKLNWTIVRPDLVLGNGSMGGGALMQGLAGLPFVMPVPAPGTQSFQPITLEDLSSGIVRLVEDETEYAGQTLYAVGPEVVPLAEIVRHYRRWLGFDEARTVLMPRFILRPILWLGDLAALFGNRSALRSTSLYEMDKFEPHDSKHFEALLGKELTTIDTFLRAQISTVVERQFARIYFLLPLVRVVLGFWWIFEGFEGGQSVGSFDLLFDQTKAFSDGLMAAFTAPLHSYVTVVFALLSMLCGVLFLSRPWMRFAGSLKIMTLLIVGIFNISYIGSVETFLGWGISMLVPILLILLLIGLYEKR